MLFSKNYISQPFIVKLITIIIFFLNILFVQKVASSPIQKKVANHNTTLQNKTSKGELHLILLWEKARYKEKEIIQDIENNLKILELYNISWSEEEVSNNFARFYGVKLPKNSGKEQHCGKGSFLLITVFDANPKYDFIETSRGTEYVNINIFSLKEKYRAWTGGGHKIHSTNNIKETNHDITLLLGINSNDYLNQIKDRTSNEVQNLNQDLVGSKGFTSLEELFYLLNATCEYAVLRNHEILPQEFKTTAHGDIDIITNELQNVIFILNAQKVFPKNYRVHYKINVLKEDVYFDFRYLSDNYFCQKWEYDLLKTRKLNDKNIYVLNDEHYFYSLIYHAILHKHSIAPDYYTKIENLFYKLKLNEKYYFNNYDNKFDLYFELLLNFMKERGYYFTKPNDLSVTFYDNFLYANDKIDYLINNYFFSNVKQTRVHEKSGADFIYFTALNTNQEKVFIKWGGYEDSVKKEYEIGNKLHAENPKYFIKPLQYKYDREIKFIVYPYVKGENLQSLLDQKSLTDENKIKLITQVKDILTILHNNNYIHRDIRPANLMVTENMDLILIDFQFCIDVNHYKEFEVVNQNPELIGKLGGDFKFKGYVWDDAYSVNKIIDVIGCPKKYQERCSNISLEVQQMIGKKQQQFIFNHTASSIAQTKWKIVKTKISTFLKGLYNRL